MKKKFNLDRFPEVTITEKHVLFNGRCSNGHNKTTRSAPLIFDDYGEFGTKSTNAIIDIIRSGYAGSELTKRELYMFIDYIRIQSLAKSEWPFNSYSVFSKNHGASYMFEEPSIEVAVI